jgi:RNA polymerase sigma factor (sigma-70 family)
MLTKQVAQDLIHKLFLLRNRAAQSKSKKDIIELSKFENHCIEQFKYLVSMRTNKYKGFSNYDDLNQEGLEALVKAMKNYDPKKGIFFYWAHKYIETRISRNANTHTTIKYPLKYAKEHTPHKENKLPILIEQTISQDKQTENIETSQIINNEVNKLDYDHRTVIDFAFGFNGHKSISINKICKKLNISRLKCIKRINTALNILRQNIIL